MSKKVVVQEIIPTTNGNANASAKSSRLSLIENMYKFTILVNPHILLEDGIKVKNTPDHLNHENLPTACK